MKRISTHSNNISTYLHDLHSVANLLPQKINNYSGFCSMPALPNETLDTIPFLGISHSFITCLKLTFLAFCKYILNIGLWMIFCNVIIISCPFDKTLAYIHSFNSFLSHWRGGEWPGIILGMGKRNFFKILIRSNWTKWLFPLENFQFVHFYFYKQNLNNHLNMKPVFS